MSFRIVLEDNEDVCYPKEIKIDTHKSLFRQQPSSLTLTFRTILKGCMTYPTINY